MTWPNFKLNIRSWFEKSPNQVRSYPRPERDWRFLLALTALVLLLLFAGYLTVLQISNQRFYQAGRSDLTASSTLPDFSPLAKSFTKRAAEFEFYLINPPAVEEPN